MHRRPVFQIALGFGVGLLVACATIGLERWYSREREQDVVPETVTDDFIRHYKTTRVVVKLNVRRATEDEILGCAAATWVGAGANTREASWMVAQVIAEGGLTADYDHDMHKGWMGAKNFVIFQAANRVEAKIYKCWMWELGANPAYATLISGQQFEHLKKREGGVTPVLRLWVAGPDYKTKRNDALRSLNYVRDVEAYRRQYWTVWKELKK